MAPSKVPLRKRLSRRNRKASIRSFYLRRQSLLLDMRIIARTVRNSFTATTLKGQ